MNAIMGKMMLSCREVTLLMEQSSEKKPAMTNRIKMKLHTSMCANCRNYMVQTHLIDRLVAHNMQIASVAGNAYVADVAKLKTDILKALGRMQ